MKTEKKIPERSRSVLGRFYCIWAGQTLKNANVDGNTLHQDYGGRVVAQAGSRQLLAVDDRLRPLASSGEIRSRRNGNGKVFSQNISVLP